MSHYKSPHIRLCCTPVVISHVRTVFTLAAGPELEHDSSVRRCRAAIGPTLTDELVLNNYLSILVTVTQTSMRMCVCVCVSPEFSFLKSNPLPIPAPMELMILSI